MDSDYKRVRIPSTDRNTPPQAEHGPANNGNGEARDSQKKK